MTYYDEDGWAQYDEQEAHDDRVECDGCGRLIIDGEYCPVCDDGLTPEEADKREQEEQAEHAERVAENPCWACHQEEATTTFMEKDVCWPCYEALSTGRGTPDRLVFADPGGKSALRAAGPGNPRVYPCPTCHAPNRLTLQDKARHYQCDQCADRAEGNYFGADY